MTTVAVTGLVIGFGLGVLAAHEARKLHRKLRRKMRRLFR
jgi:hypothetical protein